MMLAVSPANLATDTATHQFLI